MFANIINKIKEMQPGILVVGDLMLDKFIFGDVLRISPEAPIPIVKLQKEEQMLGGCGNVIKNLNNLGVSASPFSVVGKDFAGDKILDLILEQNISVSNISRLENIRTTEKMRIVAGKQQVARVDWDMDKINSADLNFENLANEIKSTSGIIISDYAKGVCSNELVKNIIQLSRHYNKPTYVDPKGSNWVKYKDATIITPNTKEAEIVVGFRLQSDKDFEIAGEKICSTYDIYGCLITRGADGMSFISKDETFHLKSEAREIFDVSGAGDTVISVLATGLVIDLSYKEASDFANQAAGIVVGHIGTSAITTDELINFD